MKFLSKILYAIPNPLILKVIRLRLLLWVAVAFASVICFFQIGSAAEKDGLFVALAIVFGLIAIAFAYVAATESEADQYDK